MTFKNQNLNRISHRNQNVDKLWPLKTGIRTKFYIETKILTFKYQNFDLNSQNFDKFEPNPTILKSLILQPKFGPLKNQNFDKLNPWKTAIWTKFYIEIKILTFKNQILSLNNQNFDKFVPNPTILKIFILKPKFWPWKTRIWTKFKLETKILTFKNQILSLNNQNFDKFGANPTILTIFILKPKFRPWKTRIWTTFYIETKMLTFKNQNVNKKLTFFSQVETKVPW